MHKPLLPWPHVARARLAEHYLDTADLTGARAITLFGARGIGKTDFLVKDLAPVAAGRGYRVVFVDLQGNIDEPARLIAEALKLGERSIDRLVRTFRTPVTRSQLSLGSTGPQLGAHFEHGDSADSLLALARAFDALKATSRRPVLFILDEAQTLARERHLPVIAALRAAFQKHDAGILRVFSGSSRNGLERMFRRARAPLFGQGGQQETFPPLAQPFIDRIADWFEAQTGGADLDRAAARRGFAVLKGSARLFRIAVAEVIAGAQPDILASCKSARESSPDLLLWQERLARLRPVERALLESIWRSREELYGAAHLEALTRIHGAAVSVSTVQSILNRFDRNGWIYRIEKGRYELDDVELEIALEEMTQQAPLPLAASRIGRPRAKLKQKG